jgi:hypothetical protein
MPEIDSDARPKAHGKSWRDRIKIHPAADLFPLMSETDPLGLRNLGNDIVENGLRSHIVFFYDGVCPNLKRALTRNCCYSTGAID